jgi:RNA-directed DNA polymerase
VGVAQQKSRVIHSTEGFDFLGFNICHRVKRGCEHIAIPFPIEGYQKEYRRYISTIIIPSKKSLKKVMTSLASAFKQHTGKPVYHLIRSTNRIIRGYCNSKRTWSVSRAFNKLTDYTYKLWVGYFKRRHPKKAYKWIKDRYVIHYQQNGFNSKWVFRDPVTGIISLKPHWFAEQRNWPPVEGARSPDDASSRDYWALRQQKRFASKNVDLHTNFDRTLAARQEHLCPVCFESLYEGETLHRHYIVPVAKGGKDTVSNLILIHVFIVYACCGLRPQQA